MNRKSAQSKEQRLPYEKPTIAKVDLALEETLSAGCKLAEVCDDLFEKTSEAGS